MGGRRFCFVLGGYFEQVIGGAEYQAYLLARRLVEVGYEVHYIYADIGREFVRTLPIILHPIRWNRGGSRLPRYTYMSQIPAVLRTLREVDPDVVYHRCASAYTWAVTHYGQKAGKCVIWHIAHQWDVMPMPLSWSNLVSGRCLEKALINGGIRRADIIVAQAKYQAELLSRHYGLEVSDIIPNVHPMPATVGEKEEGVVNVLWAANLKPAKRPMAYIELARALQHLERVRFFMVGKGQNSKLAEAVRDCARELPNLRLLGGVTQDEVNALMERAHIFINTSSAEGFPNTFIQAWLRKVPVISLEVDPDGVLTREGVGIRSGTMAQVVEDCAALSKDPDRRRAMGNRAREYAERTFQVEPNVDRMLALVGRWERAREAGGEHGDMGRS
jgi:glycosyltransferase involved in cell wall biosynthesis